MMNASSRVMVNTFAQYVRTIINMVLSLYSVRVVLLALGESDYGTYTLVAGIVSMLSFLTSSLAITTQRFVSFYIGRSDRERVKEFFNTSLVIHIVIGLMAVAVLEVFQPLLFGGKALEIPSTRLGAASTVYQFVVLMLFLSLLSSPFRALLVSHENIVYVSAVDILDGVLKVLFAILMAHSNYDKLVVYGFFMTFVQLFNFLALSVFDYIKYDECVLPRISLVKREYLSGMMSFASWSLYSSGCLIGRQQGIAIVLNRIAGTVMNSAYGLAIHIAGYTNFLSTALANAITPQIIKSEGEGNRKRALWLSTITCKMMFFLISAVCIPCIFEVDEILNLWLHGEVPEHTSLFCIMVMLALIADSTTMGLAYINQAIGNIRAYSVIINTPKLLVVPIALALFHFGSPLMTLLVAYVVVEFACAMARLPFIRKNAGLDISEFCHRTFRMELIPVLLCVASCIVCTYVLQFRFRFVVTFTFSMAVYAASIYLFGLMNDEKNILFSILVRMKGKFKVNA